MILDPQVTDAIDALAGVRARARALDDDRGRLLAALVATCRLPGLERGDEALDERADRLLVGARHLVDDGLAGKDVPLHREARPDPVTRPVETIGAGECRGAPVGGDEPELARLTARVGLEHAPQCVSRLGTACELGKCPLAVDRNAGGLRRSGADPGAHPRDDRADREVPRLDGTTDLTGLEVGRDDREGALREALVRRDG